MQQRDKKIVWGIAGLVGLYVGYGFFHSWFIKPVNDLDDKIASATILLDQAERKERELKFDTAALADARRISLPRNRSEAKRLYLKWIVELTEACGIITTKNPEAGNERTDGGTLFAYPVKVEGYATYEQAMLFLRRFSEVNLLQRLSQFELDITTAGDPRLFLRFTAEGVSLVDAEDRPTLLPETLLVDDLPPEQTSLTVAGLIGFPEKAPFRVKVGPEWMQVTNANKTQWTVERGIGESKAIAHTKGAPIELCPLKPPGKTEPTAQAIYTKLAATNPFRKPRPPVEFKPRISPSGNQLVTKGTPLSLKLKAESWDPEAGVAKFVAEGELPPGLTLDEKTGAIQWSPAKDLPPGEYKLKVAAIGTYNAAIRTTADFTFRVREANQPPTFKDVRPKPAFLGQAWTLEVAATDADPNDKLKYALSGTPPMGAAVDSAGKVSWTPAEDLEPGDVSLSVTATDTGDPPMTTTKTVTVRVEEDAARFTKFVGLVTEEGQQEAWFFDPSINKNTKLKVGSLFRFADVEGTVAEIQENGEYVILSTGGKRMRLNSGKTLREMTAEPDPPTPAASPAPAAKPNAEPTTTTGT
jgi:hypothetical protein